MLIHEQFYTSAPALLDATSSNLGVIAQTRNFPKELEADLDSHRSYTLRREDVRDAASCPPRFAIAVCGRQKSHLVISRVSFAGADHTGRTRPFAHHLALRCDEMERDGVEPASFVSFATRALRDAWDGPPTLLEPRPWNDGIAIPPDQISPKWRDLLPTDQRNTLLANVADALVADPTSRSPVIVCIPSAAAHAVIEICADVLSLLPTKVQAGSVCVSHVVDMADYLRDSALIFTYPDTPFVFQARQRQDVRRPLIVDLTNQTLPAHPIGPYAEALTSRPNGKSLVGMRSLAKLWDECGLTPVYKSNFPHVVHVRERLTTRPAAPDVTAIAVELASLADAPILRERVEGWCQSFLQGLLDLPVSQRWTAVYELASDGRWPEHTRSAAFDELARHAESALPSALGDGATIGSEYETTARELARRIPLFPAVASAAVRLALTQPNERRLSFAATAIGKAKPDFASAVQWWDDVAGGGDEVQRRLGAAVALQLTQTARSGKDLASMRERAKFENPHAQFNRDIYRQVLRSHFSTASNDKLRRQLAELLMTSALQDSSPDASANELSGLLEVHRSAITAQLMETWLQRARDTVQEAALQRVGVEAGLHSGSPSAPVLQPQPDPRQHHRSPPAPPLFGEGGKRFKPMRVGRERGVLPRGVLHALLFVLVAGITALWIANYFHITRIWTRNPWRYVSLAGLGFASWLVSILIDVAVRPHPGRLGLAFGIRKVMAVVLIALLGVLAWTCISNVYPGGPR